MAKEHWIYPTLPLKNSVLTDLVQYKSHRLRKVLRLFGGKTPGIAGSLFKAEFN